jgi:hypothetical protein
MTAGCERMNFSRNIGHVWAAPGMRGIFADILVVPDLQSCIRPVRAVDPTAGLDGFR